jgi:hypothetical protein
LKRPRTNFSQSYNATISSNLKPTPDTRNIKFSDNITIVIKPTSQVLRVALAPSAKPAREHRLCQSSLHSGCLRLDQRDQRDQSLSPQIHQIPGFNSSI